MENGQITSIVGDQAVLKPIGKLAEIGSRVFVKEGVLGRVVDIIGPVDDPCLVVKLSGKKEVSVGDKVSSS